ncbi:MAG: copper transporter [Actinomycetota bacterium]|nr:copper transporter [Actinomycetota bacterium]
MFDFRYHALSLVAVFLALMIGLLLGVAIGDKGLVSSGERQLRDTLRSELRAAQTDASKLRTQLAEQKRFQDAVYPLLVANRLGGRRIGLVGLGDLPDSTIGAVRDALQGTGGQLAGVTVVREPVPPTAVEQVPGASSPPSPGDYGKLGGALATALLRGGKPANALTRALLESSSGNLAGARGVVVYRAPRQPGGPDAPNVDAFEAGLVGGVLANGAQAVGAEDTGTMPSQIRWFRTHRVSSVDDLDQVAGKGALVFVLAGANGAFGIKDTAQALLPDAAAPAG